jgi:hypothetical protein
VSKIFVLALATACTLLSESAMAAITVYTTEASFLAAIQTPGVDGFNDISLTTITSNPVVRAAGAYTYTASLTSTGLGFLGAGTTENPWLSTIFSADTIKFVAFSNGVSGVGGNFFDSDVNSTFLSGNINVKASDDLGANETRVLVAATTSTFLGFVSDGLITSVSVNTTVQQVDTPFPTVDNLTIGVKRELFADGFE